MSANMNARNLRSESFQSPKSSTGTPGPGRGLRRTEKNPNLSETYVRGFAKIPAGLHTTRNNPDLSESYAQEEATIEKKIALHDLDTLLSHGNTWTLKPTTATPKGGTLPNNTWKGAWTAEPRTPKEFATFARNEKRPGGSTVPSSALLQEAIKACRLKKEAKKAEQAKTNGL